MPKINEDSKCEDSLNQSERREPKREPSNQYILTTFSKAKINDEERKALESESVVVSGGGLNYRKHLKGSSMVESVVTIALLILFIVDGELYWVRHQYKL